MGGSEGNQFYWNTIQGASKTLCPIDEQGDECNGCCEKKKEFDPMAPQKYSWNYRRVPGSVSHMHSI
jgi:hypothetical protein